MYRKHDMISLSNKERKINMMLVDNLILTVKDEDDVIMNRHFNEVYVKIDSNQMMIANKKKTIAVYKLDDVLYIQTQGHPRQFKLFQ